jgi:hypothetical protein
MFFISWGARGKVAQVGSAGVRHCHYCDKDAYFTRVVQYTVRHVYWVFRWVSSRTPFLICGNCGGAHASDYEDNDLPEVRQAIPQWDRRGWLAGVGGIAAIVATGTLAVAADHQSDRNYVATPHVGDVYETDFARLVEKPERPEMYTAMRVTRVSGGQVEVEIAKTYYEDSRGVDRDINNGAAAAPGYYDSERKVFAQSAIQKMFDDGVVSDVRR